MLVVFWFQKIHLARHSYILTWKQTAVAQPYQILFVTKNNYFDQFHISSVHVLRKTKMMHQMEGYSFCKGANFLVEMCIARKSVSSTVYLTSACEVWTEVRTGQSLILRPKISTFVLCGPNCFGYWLVCTIDGRRFWVEWLFGMRKNYPKAGKYSVWREKNFLHSKFSLHNSSANSLLQENLLMNCAEKTLQPESSLDSRCVFLLGVNNPNKFIEFVLLVLLLEFWISLLALSRYKIHDFVIVFIYWPKATVGWIKWPMQASFWHIT